MNSKKRTQTKPIFPAYTVGKIAPSAVEGPVISMLCRKAYQNDFRIFRLRTIFIVK
jgi:hypothetical protein